MVEQSPRSIQIVAPDGSTLHVNAAWERLFGVTAAERADWNILTDEFLNATGAVSYIRRAFAGETVTIPPFEHVTEIDSESPTARWIEAFVYPVKDDDGTVREVAIIHEDVTARIESEALLREREEQYRRIFDATSDGLIISDPTRGVVLEANPAVCRMHGFTYKEFIGLHGTAFIHPDYHPVFVDFLQTIMAGGTYQTEAMDLRKDGSSFYVEVHGSGVMYEGQPRVLAVVRDITERVKARELLEQRVTERTRELSTLLDVSHNIASTLELTPLLSLIIDGLQSLVDFRGATVDEDQGGHFVTLYRRGPGDSEEVMRQAIPIDTDSLLWNNIGRGMPVIIDDMRDDSQLARDFRAAHPSLMTGPYAYVRSWMGVPMMLKDRRIGLLALGSDQAGFYTERHARLAQGIANQAAIAIENARLYERAQEVAILEERQRLARELHDSVSQALYGIALGARTARALLANNPKQAAEPLDYVLAQAETGLAEMRALIFELRPETLENEGLIGALSRQMEALHARHGITFREQMGEEPHVPIQVKETAYRIVQEALHNTVKHAGARTIDVELACRDGELILEIADDGAGFDPGLSYPGHLGLSTMRERAVRVGGTLTVESAPGRGTRVRARIPTSHV